MTQTNHEPELVECFQVTGWHRGIVDRRSDNLSDGMIFSTLNRAYEYIQKTRLIVSRCAPIMLHPDDPQIDFHLCDWEEQKRRLDIAFPRS